MLKQLRENTKTILWIVVVAFVVSIFAVWGMNLDNPSSPRQDDNAVGRVNGESVTRTLYSNSFTQVYDQMKQQRGEEYEPNQMERLMMAEQAWELAIQKILMAKEIEKLQITVSDAELVDFLRRNPHPTLQQVFRTEDDQFDYQAYLRSLSDPEVDWTELEHWGRSLLPELKLQTYISSQVHVSEQEIMERFKRETAEVKARYVKIPFPTEESVYEPSEREIDSLYAAAKESYTIPEKRRVKILTIEKEPTEADEREVLDRLEEIRNEILSGREFSEMASIYSEDPMTAEKGGDLGFFGRGSMLQEFEDAAFSLDVGAMSGPVRTDYGYHLIKLEERKREKDEEKIRARHILMRVEPGYETIDSLSTLIRELNEEIKSKGLEKAAEVYGLTIQEPEPFKDGYFIEGVGFAPRVVNFSFSHEPNSISAPLEEERAVYYVKVMEEMDEGVEAKDDIRIQLVDRIRRERLDDETRNRAESIRKQAVTSGNLESAALAAGLDAEETSYFKRGDAIPGIGGNTPFAVASHLLPVGEISTPIRSGNAYFLIRVADRKLPDMDLFTSRSAEIAEQLNREKTMRFIAGWFDEIRQNAEVVDNRERLLN
jgi:peptidyl-prolyl cis-trans isomerase D